MSRLRVIAIRLSRSGPTTHAERQRRIGARHAQLRHHYAGAAGLVKLKGTAADANRPGADLMLNTRWWGRANGSRAAG